MKNKFTRLIALLLCLLMLGTALIACDEQGSDGETTTTETNVPPPAPPTPPSTIAQLELEQSNGMSYVARLKDGRYIIVDGGAESWSNKLNLFAYLSDNNTREGKPVIACWIITHFDGDHFDNAYSFWKTYRSRVEIQGIAYTTPDPSEFDERPGDDDYTKEQKGLAKAVLVERLARWENVDDWFPNAFFWDLTAGEERTFSDVKVKVLITAKERVPDNIYTNNQRSAVFQLIFTQDTEDTADDKKFMVFGDNSGDARQQWLIATYGKDVLKSDVMQTIHHGLAGGHLGIYRMVDPGICFWPTSQDRFEGKYDSNGNGDYLDDYQWCIDPDYNKWLRNDRIRQRQHYHHTQTVIVNMSDLSVTVIPSQNAAE